MYKLSLNDVNLYIVGRTNENPPWRHSGRKMNYNHILIVISGSCVCRVENDTYELNPYDLLFIPADKFYSLETSSHCEYYFACFYAHLSDAENDNNLYDVPLNTPDKKFFLPQSEKIKESIILLPLFAALDNKTYSLASMLFTKLIKLNSTGDYLDRLSMDVYFKEILLLAARACTGTCQTKKYPHILEQMIAYINENYTECITAETLSDIFFVSKTHVCTLFSANLGMTVSEYVNSVKLVHATELLSNSSMNITQIAEYLGFSSLHYFTRVFKKFYGISPSRYSVTIIDK